MTACASEKGKKKTIKVPTKKVHFIGLAIVIIMVNL